MIDAGKRPVININSSTGDIYKTSYNGVLNVIQDILNDNRIHNSVRKEYRQKLLDALENI